MAIPTSADTVTLVHLSDVHLGPLPLIPLGLLNAKRAAGALNWFHKRRHVHRPDVAARLARDVAGLGADHIAVSGDLANLGLPEEISRAAAWLRQLGPPDQVSVVPGNHDIYSVVRGQRRGTAALAPWAAHFTSCAEGASYTSGPPFPFVRIVGRGAVRLALIGLNSAIETPPLVAIGKLGGEQLRRLADCLDATARAGFVRVVMLHHPPLPGLARANHDLIDAPALAAVLKQHGAELVIHGHNHRRMISPSAGPSGQILCVGVPSASAGLSRNGEPLARAHIFEFAVGARGAPPRIRLIARGLGEPDGPIIELERTPLAGDGAGNQ